MAIRGGLIAAVDAGTNPVVGAIDLDGDWLLPGLVELHTDNLERLFSPRPGVRWPADAAMLTHDAQVAAAGITTVCDAVCVGFYGGKSERLDYLNLSIDVLRRARRPTRSRPSISCICGWRSPIRTCSSCSSR